MKRKLVLSAALAFGVLLFGMTPASHATAVLTLTNGAASVTINDGGAGDLSATTGQVLFAGVVGNYFVNVTTGISGSPDGSNGLGYMDLNSVDISGGTSNANGGTLVIQWSDIGFTIDAPAVVMNIGGTTAGTVQFQSCYNTANVIGCGTDRNIELPHVRGVQWICNRSGARWYDPVLAYRDRHHQPFGSWHNQFRC